MVDKLTQQNQNLAINDAKLRSLREKFVNIYGRGTVRGHSRPPSIEQIRTLTNLNIRVSEVIAKMNPFTLN